MTLALITTAPDADTALRAWASLAAEVHRGEDLATLHAAVSSDWVLRVEADELPSPQLLAALPTALADPDLSRVALLRRWLAPPALGGPDGGWLDEPPWAPDPVLRLVRAREDPTVWADRWAMDAASVPRTILAEPLVCSLLIDEPRAARRDRGVVEEAFDPAAVGVDRRPRAVLLDPETHARRTPVRTAATTAPSPGDPGAELTIACLERDVEVPTHHGRAVLVAVTNHSARRWPGPGEDGPVLRLSQHVRTTAGELVAEGPPQELTAPLAPGQTRVVPVWVSAPEHPAGLVVEVGIVEDHARWLPGGRVGTFAARAVPAPEPAVRRAGRPPPPAARRRRWWRAAPAVPAIPHVLHRVWLGGGELPAEHAAYGETWRAHHPRWELRVWGDDDAPRPVGLERARNLAERADLVRYEVLRRHGGVYVDTDVECLRPIDALLEGIEAFAAYEVPGRVCNAVLGATPGHPFFADAVRLAARTVGTGVYPSATATDFLTRVAEDLHPEVELFGPERFYPFLWDEAARPADAVGDAHAIHHWANSWIAQDA